MTCFAPESLSLLSEAGDTRDDDRVATVLATTLGVLRFNALQQLGSFRNSNIQRGPRLPESTIFA
jgi:hypothetical protein